MSIAYLIQGIPGCGRTTFAAQKAKDSGGVALHMENFFYQVHAPHSPTEYSFDSGALRRRTHWWWVSLKRLADAGATPIYIDQDNYLQPATWKVAAFLMERYGYDIELLHPDTQWWSTVRELLQEPSTNKHELDAWAAKLAEKGDKGITTNDMQIHMKAYSEYTIEDLIDRF